jgi:hypothetical protein
MGVFAAILLLTAVPFVTPGFCGGCHCILVSSPVTPSSPSIIRSVLGLYHLDPAADDEKPVYVHKQHHSNEKIFLYYDTQTEPLWVFGAKGFGDAGNYLGVMLEQARRTKKTDTAIAAFDLLGEQVWSLVGSGYQFNLRVTCACDTITVQTSPDSIYSGNYRLEDPAMSNAAQVVNFYGRNKTSSKHAADSQLPIYRTVRSGKNIYLYHRGSTASSPGSGWWVVGKGLFKAKGVISAVPAAGAVVPNAVMPPHNLFFCACPFVMLAPPAPLPFLGLYRLNNKLSAPVKRPVYERYDWGRREGGVTHYLSYSTGVGGKAVPLGGGGKEAYEQATEIYNPLLFAKDQNPFPQWIISSNLASGLSSGPKNKFTRGASVNEAAGVWRHAARGEFGYSIRSTAVVPSLIGEAHNDYYAGFEQSWLRWIGGASGAANTVETPPVVRAKKQPTVVRVPSMRQLCVCKSLFVQGSPAKFLNG